MSSNDTSKVPIKHIAQLANIPIQPQEEKKLEKAFEETLEVVSNLKNVDVSAAQPTYQVTGLENIFRDDVVNEQNMLSQKQALANAQESYDGYVLVPQIRDEK